MHREHRARIFWSAEQMRLGLPTALEGTDPAWVSPDPSESNAWSLRFRFSASPVDLGSPTEAIVSFLLEDAPHHALLPGSTLRLFERGTRMWALVEILD
jgi:hypothetical protein